MRVLSNALYRHLDRFFSLAILARCRHKIHPKRFVLQSAAYWASSPNDPAARWTACRKLRRSWESLSAIAATNEFRHRPTTKAVWDVFTPTDRPVVCAIKKGAPTHDRSSH